MYVGKSHSQTNRLSATPLARRIDEIFAANSVVAAIGTVSRVSVVSRAIAD
jgi:hypothetical protein